MSDAAVIVWFRWDLRLDDHPALHAALETGRPVVGLFVLDDAFDGRPLGAAARWWLQGSLERLRAALEDIGVPLLLRRGASQSVVPEAAGAVGASAVHWTTGTTPFLRRLDDAVAAGLRAVGVAPGLAPSDLIAEPDAVRTGSGAPYRVFTPFWKCLTAEHRPAPPAPLPQRRPPPPAAVPAGEALADWGLLPRRPDWAGGLRETWTPGEDAAQRRLHDFLKAAVDRYAAERDAPALEATSRLSPHLRFGEISARRVWQTAEAAAGDRAGAFLREVGWREFNHHLLFQQPAMATEPMRPEFRDFPWAEDEAAFRTWCRGRTGYPVVDAGLRELWHSGWMHNRVRMIAASFLVKDLLVPWQWGERWFWDTLVDADAANNPGNWQWVAGCGADAAPYFRIFNPTLQGEKFDPRGHYVRRWVPELAGQRDLGIHRPGGAGDLFGGGSYPAPMVDHGSARRRALHAYERITQASRRA